MVQATAGEAANHHRSPHLQVRFRVSHYDWLAGGSAGGMQTHHLLHRAGKQPEGIGIPQVGFGRERQLADVVDRAQVVWRQSALPHMRAEPFHSLPSPLHNIP
jgi:hypothetical protein